MAKAQLSLFGAAPAASGPEGLAYRPELLDAREEATLAAKLAELPFRAFEFHGYLGHRRTLSYGWHYSFDGSGLKETEAVPDWLLPCRAKAAAFAGLAPEALEHVLLTEYAPGAGIGWHRDRPVFGDVVGLSLLAPARMRFRRKAGARWERENLLAEPRSAYLLRGPAREQWEHSIPPMEALRYSITFRTLRAPSERPGRAGKAAKPQE
ncbi:alpha-ketoglutarate-dependent dioxygenase AlkB [Sphingomonas parva]|uniref:Alpha-ketoglutarate-dependent dioxygenase AlkB n=1 Tax=Sphingomonas parva TaxID=2555898 RepID=A0A4Y8ZLY4_9SPHN|nr:alpha-ketoglutarate-dependent dioxygenase AlkB [Sphingomonas parva]TFI57011.1 alpha-ketoglutarate-dependent dioxygenase AlkB [Sphingomonas parva]